MPRTMAALFIITLAVIIAPADARDREYSLSFRKGDLDTPRAVAALYADIVAEAEDYCGDMYRTTAGLSRRPREAECIEDVIRDLVEQVGDRRLYALYEDDRSDKYRNARRHTSSRRAERSPD